MTEKKASPLNDLIFNVIVPSVVLMKLSSDEYLGSVGALVIALAFPIVFGGYELIKYKKFNFISLLGFVSVLLTGGIGLLELDNKWLAVKEALIPGLIGIGVFVSTFTKYPVVSKLLINDTVLNMSLIHEKLREFGKSDAFERSLVIANYLFASTFVFSSVMNYVLAKTIVTSPSGSQAFNEELGRLTLVSYPMIAIPSMLMMMGIFFYMWRQIRQMTQLKAAQILKSES
ncbi:VC0807 family protein [Photobacterium nomapromontoriensis]|uniref:VC0807 family protein n=1 Tax=Photobacterium nomapromontoriensis TaxID=2910237 RepID=UPI003D103159